MKKFIFCFLLLGIAGLSLFAWEPNDLTKFPKGMSDNDWILNFGMGLHIHDNFGDRDFIWFPPLRVSFDKNVPVSEMKLPFFFGGLVSYTGEGWKDDWFTHKITTGFRAGYHFNFNIDGLDIYAVTTAGWTHFIHSNNRAPRHDRYGDFYLGSNLGVRYFITEGFGFWAEAGYNPFSFVDLGLVWKF